MSKNSSDNNGIGIVGLLGIVFIVLKLTGVIDWSWWWITLPFWGVVPLIILVIIFIGLFELFFKLNK